MFNISQILTSTLIYGVPRTHTPYGDVELLEFEGYGHIAPYVESVDTPQGVVTKYTAIVIVEEKVQVGWFINGHLCYKVEPYIAPYGEVLRKAYISSTKLNNPIEGE